MSLMNIIRSWFAKSSETEEKYGFKVIHGESSVYVKVTDQEKYNRMLESVLNRTLDAQNHPKGSEND